MNVGMMKRSAEKLIKAEGRKETLAALSDFAQVCGPENILALIEQLEKVMSDRNRFAANFKSMCDIWSDVDTYARTHAGKKIGESVAEFALELLKEGDAAKAERDTARQQAATLRAALAAVFGTDDLIALEVLGANYQHSGATKVAKQAHEKIVAAIDVLIATHPDNNPENKA